MAKKVIVIKENNTTFRFKVENEQELNDALVELVAKRLRQTNVYTGDVAIRASQIVKDKDGEAAIEFLKDEETDTYSVSVEDDE